MDGKCVPTCETVEDCMDTDPCTIERCEEGRCFYDWDESCNTGCTDDYQCDDGNPCTNNYCFDGVCSAEDNGSCGGTCAIDSECDDQNPCTDDKCTEGSCDNVDNGTCNMSCTDDVDCGPQQICEEYICKFQPCVSDTDCVGESICQIGTCQTDGMCIFVAGNEGMDCDSPYELAVNGYCEAGECVGVGTETCSMDENCADSSICTMDTCIVDNVCEWKYDFNACDDFNPCTIDSCDMKSDSCMNQYQPDGFVCDDGNENTIEDQCQAGVCVGVEKCISDTDCFENEMCDIESGQCVENVVQCQLDEECNDSNDCTDDFCNAGICENTDNGSCPVSCTLDSDCDDFDYCTIDSCVNGVCENEYDTGCQ